MRPICPKCGMRMICVDGFKLDPEHKAFECLKCGHRLSIAKQAAE